MGTYITLDIGKMELISSKNDPGIDRGRLFHEKDRKPIVRDQDYAYECPNGFQTTLSEVLPRLEMLGHTLSVARQEYESAVDINVRRRVEYAKDAGEPEPSFNFFSFDEILEIAAELDPSALSTAIDEDDEQPIRILAQELMERLPWYDAWDYAGRSYEPDTVFSQSTSAEYVLGGFHPYTVMRLLAENPRNLSSFVTWDYGPLVSNGYAREEEFTCSRRDQDCFLIVTEGGSDAAMLRHAISLLRPQIADFFRYIDMEEGYPFSGTGQLHKFMQGLVAMRLPLNVVAVYDNDAEGVSAHGKTNALKLLASYRVCILPDLDEFSRFPTTGPTGLAMGDINRRAASLECYLDLSRRGLPDVVVQWGGFNDIAGSYQGSLKGKAQFMNDFLGYRGKEDRRGAYDFMKLEKVLDVLVGACVEIASEAAASMQARRLR
ncbi:HEPN/Toprim-associated domain-containing protein [Agrobacterium deltaense]|uniref:HEPN/Toprim-associated domain-containing protein n=1 Tax=Agrobacterium deltaense TaxID=1183412 RepID=UPI003FD248D8